MAIHSKKKRGNETFDLVGDYVYEHRIFPSPTHGEHSPNDNSFNAECKNAWKGERGEFYDEVVYPICLMRMTDIVHHESVTRYFVRNLMLDEENITLAKVEKLLKGKSKIPKDRENLWDACSELYRDFIDTNDQINWSMTPKNIGSDLDGGYWS